MLEGHELADVLSAMEIVAGGFLDTMLPGADGDRFLQQLGLFAADGPPPHLAGR